MSIISLLGFAASKVHVSPNVVTIVGTAYTVVAAFLMYPSIRGPRFQRRFGWYSRSGLGWLLSEGYRVRMLVYPLTSIHEHNIVANEKR